MNTSLDVLHERLLTTGRCQLAVAAEREMAAGRERAMCRTQRVVDSLRLAFETTKVAVESMQHAIACCAQERLKSIEEENAELQRSEPPRRET